MDYPSIRGEELPDYARKATWNLLDAYIDAHSQILIDEFTGDGVQDISIFQSQCAKMTFIDQCRYNKLFQKALHKGGESAIKYIKIFQNYKALAISVGNSYSEYHLMYILLQNFQQGGKYSSQIATHQSELRDIDQKSLSISDLQIDYLNLENSVRNNDR